MCSTCKFYNRTNIVINKKFLEMQVRTAFLLRRAVYRHCKSRKSFIPVHDSGSRVGPVILIRLAREFPIERWKFLSKRIMIAIFHYTTNNLKKYVPITMYIKNISKSGLELKNIILNGEFRHNNDKNRFRGEFGQHFKGRGCP